MTLFSSGFGPAPRDELVAWSSAPLWQGHLSEPPELGAPSPPGRTWHVAGQDVFVRSVDGPREAPETWCIHGLDGSATNWDRLAAVLSPFSSVRAVDLPGSGCSGPPPAGRYDLDREAQLVARMIDRSSHGAVHLVGNSRGGVLATMIAARYPSLVRSLTLISPAVPDFRVVGERGANPSLGLVMLPGTTKSAVRQVSRITPAEHARGLALSCFGQPELLTENALAAAEAAYVAREKQPWAPLATVESLRSLIRSQMRTGRRSFANAARAVRVPTLVVWGTRDRLVDARLAAPTVRLFADGRLLMLALTGHVAQMERPEPVARAMLQLWHDVEISPARGAPQRQPVATVAP